MFYAIIIDGDNTMKRKICYLLLAPLFILSITSCNKMDINNESSTTIEYNPSSTNLINYDTDSFVCPKPTNTTGYKVTYDCNNGFEYTSITDSNNKVLEPTSNPTKVASTFLGWYSDEDCTKLYDFNKTVSYATTIYAGYETDYLELTNKISNNILHTAVKVEGVFYNASLSGSTALSTGSGVIIGNEDDSYYCLTNNHVIYRPSDYQYSNYYVYDCYGTKYIAYVIYNDANYDLALIMFTKTTSTTYTNDITNIKFSNILPDVDDVVISVGNPYRVSNTIIYGNYEGLQGFSSSKSTKAESNITFKVISHSGEIYDGSSGSMLLDSNLRLVGINFAVENNFNNEFHNSCAIPLEKVIEFINNYSNSIK